jgi:D-cysteine desulfhydrase
VADIPLLGAFPGLRTLQRVELCAFPSPVISATLDDGRTQLWIKQDDRNAPFCGGNKARTLEWILADIHPGDLVITLGGEGSTHALATAVHAARLGVGTIALRWRHDMNPTAHDIAQAIPRWCTHAPVYRTSVGAILRASLLRAREQYILDQRHRSESPETRRPRVHLIPLGGSVPLGVLAHVNAGLELAQQIQTGILPAPTHLVVPLGSGGTTAGLLLGLAIAELDTIVCAVQVTPRLVANRFNVMRLVSRTATLIERLDHHRVTRPLHSRLNIIRTVYGGAYGREVPLARRSADALAGEMQILLDQTYSAKAFAAALELARESPEHRVLFWNTFDGQLLGAPLAPIRV